MIRPPIALAALLALALLAGCATPVRKLHVHELPRLPKTEGFYGGKMLTIPPEWVYQGTSDRYHRFLYTYTRGNLIHQIRVWVPKDELDVPFAVALKDAPAGGIRVVPIPDSATGGYIFAKAPPPSPPNQAEPEWLRFNPAPKWSDAPPPAEGELRIRAMP